jgi:hypothetical protein
MTCNYTASGSGLTLLFTASHSKAVHKGKHNDEVAPVHLPIHVCDNLFFFLVQQPPVSQGLLIHEVSRSHTMRRTTVGWTLLDEWSARRDNLNYWRRVEWRLILWANIERFQINLILKLYMKPRLKINISHKRTIQKSIHDTKHTCN